MGIKYTYIFAAFIGMFILIDAVTDPPKDSYNLRMKPSPSSHYNHTTIKIQKFSLGSVHASAYIAAMVTFLSVLAYQKAVQHPGF